MILDDYELIGDEYVKKIPLLSEKEINKHVEIDIPSFFDKMGYKIKKIPTSATRTVDYEYEDLGLEVTSVRKYLPRNDEVDKLLTRHCEPNSRICAYVYLKDGKPKIEILDEQRLDNNVSILCLRQHISCYRPKLINKIEDKYTQDGDHSVNIIIIDFRLAHFDSLSLKREIKTILTDKGMEFPALGGILVSVPKRLNSDMLGNDSDYVFISNNYCKSDHAIFKQLDSCSLATTSNWITLNHTFIKKPSNVTAISVPCFDCPEKGEIERRGFPTFY